MSRSGYTLWASFRPGAWESFSPASTFSFFLRRAETFGLAAVEAASAGIPFVVTDLAVLREVLSVEGKPAALFVDASDTARLSAAVSRVVDDKLLRDELRQNASGLRSRYSVKAMVDAYVEIIEAL